MYSALQMARHLINYSVERNIPISNLILSKYIYLLDNIHKDLYGEKLVIEECKHSKYGAVYDDVYYEYIEYSYNEIDKQEYYFEIEYNKEIIRIERNKYKIEPIKDCKVWSSTRYLFNKYGDLSVWELVDLTKKMLQENQEAGRYESKMQK